MQMTTSATIDIARSCEAVFDFACAGETYVKLFRPLGPVAGVVSYEMMGGADVAVGARRRMTLTDGAILDEDVIAFDRPTRHTYRWSRGLRGIGRLLVRGGEGDWIFTAHDGHTTIDWRYTFTLRSALVYPLARVMLRQFRRWMEQNLRAIDSALTA
jgi:Polyketide cyclase / dehydrase and lipid transport